MDYLGGGGGVETEGKGGWIIWGGGKGMLAPHSNDWGGLAPLFLRLCYKSNTISIPKISILGEAVQKLQRC